MHCKRNKEESAVTLRDAFRFLESRHLSSTVGDDPVIQFHSNHSRLFHPIDRRSDFVIQGEDRRCTKLYHQTCRAKYIEESGENISCPTRTAPLISPGNSSRGWTYKNASGRGKSGSIGPYSMPLPEVSLRPYLLVCQKCEPK